MHGDIQTPVFMPVGTNGAIKALSVEQVESLNPSIILANSYHLYLRPGIDLLREAGGLHKFASWDRAYLTDSGGFQVFSLSKMRKFDPDGVHFQSHIDGSRHFYTPELVMEIEAAIGSDLAMVLDDCPALPATPDRLEASVNRRIRACLASSKAGSNTICACDISKHSSKCRSKACRLAVYRLEKRPPKCIRFAMHLCTKCPKISRAI